MRVALADRERRSLLFIGQLRFTYEDPGPKEIELRDLSPDQINQLVYNWRQGVLVVDDENQLKSWGQEAPASAKSFSTPAEAPIPPAEPIKNTQEVVDDRKKELRKLLAGRIPTIKAALPSLRVGELRTLLELEKDWKARKKVMAMFEEALEKHAQQVVRSVGTADLGDMANIYADDRVAAMSTQLSDIVESEIEQIVLNPSLEE